jgi:molybdate transport system permease protein
MRTRRALAAHWIYPNKTWNPCSIAEPFRRVMQQLRRIFMNTTQSLITQTDWHPLVLSIQVASVATLLALVVGLALGWLFARKRFWGHSVLEAVFMLPLVLPPTVIGYGILVVAGRRSPLGAWLREHFDYTIIFSWHGAVVASAVVALPLVLKSASAAFAGVDRSLEAAASTLRQSRFSVFLRVTLPLAWPGILAGTLLAFARAMGEFGASLMVAGSIPQQTQTLSMAIYDAVQAGHDDLALLLVIVTSLLSITVLVLSNRFFSLR